MVLLWQNPNHEKGLATIAVIALVLGVVIAGGGIFLYGDWDGDNLKTYRELTGTKTNIFHSDTDGDGLKDGIEVEKYSSNPTKKDTDGDGLSDFKEVRELHTNPSNSDTDGDGLTDGSEILEYKTDPLNPDTDGDGLTDGTEISGWKITYKVTGSSLRKVSENVTSNPKKKDTDDDNLFDKKEKSEGTHPRRRDTDKEGLSDYQEIEKYGTNPISADTDVDGLNDSIELRKYGTDPMVADTDEDRLLDGKEVEVGTNPKGPDTDGEGVEDGTEVKGWTITYEVLENSLRQVTETVTSNPLKRDTDEDGLDDQREKGEGTHPSREDTDKDGLTNPREIETYRTDPLSADTDHDKLSDHDEINVYSTFPNENDSDGDWIEDGEEIKMGLEPMDCDTDNDSYPDGWEINYTGPASENLTPKRRDILVEVDRVEGARGLYSEEVEDLRSEFASAPVRNPDGSWGIDLIIRRSDIGLPNKPKKYKNWSYDQLYGSFGRGWIYALLAPDLGGAGGLAHPIGTNNTFLVLSTENIEAGEIFMHELGHVLGLAHTVFNGVDSENCSPSEYSSVMNYNYLYKYNPQFSEDGIFNDWKYLSKGFGMNWGWPEFKGCWSKRSKRV